MDFRERVGLVAKASGKVGRFVGLAIIAGGIGVGVLYNAPALAGNLAAVGLMVWVGVGAVSYLIGAFAAPRTKGHA